MTILDTVASFKPFLMRTYCGMHSRLLGGAVTKGPCNAKVAFTFDDGPDDIWTKKVMDALEVENARATFFMLGEHMEKHVGIAEEVFRRGHEIACHLFTHDRSVADDDVRFKSELKKCRDLIMGITGAAPKFIRFPFAYLGKQRPKRVFKELEIRVAHWSFSSVDSRLDARQITRRVSGLLFPGAIVLFHDGIGRYSKYAQHRQETVKALPELLRNCKAQGLTPLTMSEMFGLDTKGNY